MSDDLLYFIPLLDEAMAQPDRRAALRRALDQIRRLGAQPRFQRGYAQFLEGLNEAARQSQKSRSGEPEPGLIEPLTTLDDELSAALAEADLILEVEGHPAQIIPLTALPITLGGIKPGHYALCMDTGWRLWEERLEAADLLWSAAYPGQPLALAADTGEQARPPSRVIELCAGHLVISIYAGLEAGTLVIERRD